MAIGDILYPLCKFDYDFMYLVLLISPMIVVALLAYNGIRLISDNDETRSKGKHGIKNAMLGLILVIAFAAVGNMLVPECVPFPGSVYAFSLATPATLGEFNVWITSPNNADLFTVGSGITFTAQTSGGSGSVQCSWNFNDKNAITSWGGCGGSHTYMDPGDYTVTVTARDDAGRTVTHRIRIRVQKGSGGALSVVINSPADGSSISKDAGTVQFDSAATGGSGEYMYLWDFGDGTGQQSIGPTPKHGYVTPGTYVVEVQVVDTSSNDATSTQITLRIT